MVWMLRDNSIHPLEFDHHLFLNNDSQKPAPKLMDDFTRAPDQRVGQLPVQQLLVLLILSLPRRPGRPNPGGTPALQKESIDVPYRHVMLVLFQALGMIRTAEREPG